jgi:hypothetical protein
MMARPPRSPLAGGSLLARCARLLRGALAKVGAIARSARVPSGLGAARRPDCAVVAQDSRLAGGKLVSQYLVADGIS